MGLIAPLFCLFHLGASITVPDGTNLNDLKTSGWWSKLSGVSNVTGGPITNTAFFMYVCKSPGNITYVTQTYYEWNGDVYYRRLDGSTWSEWTMISVQKFLRPYTDLNGLASALGAVVGPATIQWKINAEPFEGVNFGHITIHHNHAEYANSRYVEIAIQCEDNGNNPTPNIKVRSTYNNVSSEWKTVTLT